MNKKLRLLVTSNCPNKCPLCCNNQFNIEEIPTIDKYDILQYDEVEITGGEPMLYPDNLANLTMFLALSAFRKHKLKIYLYTSKIPTREVLATIDGICYTPHSKKDVEEFIQKHEEIEAFNHLSLRLNVFPEVRKFLPDIISSEWKIKQMQWIKDCPVPEGEDFRRLLHLWN